MKQRVIGVGFAVLRATRLHRVIGALTRGRGAIIMLHQVRPWIERPFAPNRLLEIEPAFLDAALTRIKQLGYDLVSMDEALRRIADPAAKPFVALTFDDGYRDTREVALPILERHSAPFAVHVTTGFADRTARLWWVELEDSIAALDRIDIAVNGERFAMEAGTPDQKRMAFDMLYRSLRSGPEARLLAVIGTLLDAAGLESAAIAERLCLDWDGLQHLAQHPLCTIGVHTLTHPMLAKHDGFVVRHELEESRRQIEMHTGLPARHLAYPVGDLTSAGPRDYQIAASLGFASAVTTRPGLIFSAHRAHPTALPRLSLNGNWQTLDSLEMLLSGVPFLLWNRGRRVVR
jgi:peptidoglycan/xylan/chitin deacetylase (PgdA/CDA1 family)